MGGIKERAGLLNRCLMNQGQQGQGIKVLELVGLELDSR